MSRFYDAIRRLRGRGDRAAIGTVTGYRGDGLYEVRIGSLQCLVPALGGAAALDGQSVAVIISGQTGKPIAMLGVVRQSGI